MTQNSPPLPGLGTVKTVSSGPVSARPLTGTGKKCGTPTRTPTQLNRRAVISHWSRALQIDALLKIVDFGCIK
jgi:hypothetical protein